MDVVRDLNLSRHPGETVPELDRNLFLDIFKLIKGGAVIRALKDVEQPVLVLPELLPSAVLRGRSKGVKAFVVEQGTGMSHGAIPVPAPAGSTSHPPERD